MLNLGMRENFNLRCRLLKWRFKFRNVLIYANKSLWFENNNYSLKQDKCTVNIVTYAFQDLYLRAYNKK